MSGQHNALRLRVLSALFAAWVHICCCVGNNTSVIGTLGWGVSKPGSSYCVCQFCQMLTVHPVLPVLRDQSAACTLAALRVYARAAETALRNALSASVCAALDGR